MTYHEWLGLLKAAGVRYDKFLRVFGKSMSGVKKWRIENEVPVWIERHTTALIELPGYKGYIMDQDLNRINGKGYGYGRTPVWLKPGKKHNDQAV